MNIITQKPLYALLFAVWFLGVSDFASASELVQDPSDPSEAPPIDLKNNDFELKYDPLNETVDESYDPSKALLRSSIPTATGTLIGLTGVLVNDVTGLDFDWLGYGGLAVAGLSLTILPSLGHFYVDNNKHAWIHMGIRAAVAGGTVGCFAASRNADLSVTGANFISNLGIFGIVGLGTLSVLDVGLSWKAAKEANKKRGLPAYGGTWALSPTILRPGRRSKFVPGIMLVGSF